MYWLITIWLCIDIECGIVRPEELEVPAAYPTLRACAQVRRELRAEDSRIRAYCRRERLDVSRVER